MCIRDSFIVASSSCQKEELFSDQSRHDLWLLHEGGNFPVVVEGNTHSKVFVIFLHGGPGGSAQQINARFEAFTDLLEADYAMVYYDQRNAGLSIGEWEESKLTIEQLVEDLEQVMSLLQVRFGNDIQLFLAGHSWGGYLGTSFLLESEQAAKIKAWININGLTHRNLNQHHALDRIQVIGEEQITSQVNSTTWENILNLVQEERDKSISQYDVDTEMLIFDLIDIAESQINRDGALFSNQTSALFPAIFSDNNDPFRLLINGNRTRNLRTQSYAFDQKIDANLASITIPSLNIYGYYDVRTPVQQGAYFLDNISTTEEDKSLIVLERSGHTSIGNEPFKVAEEMKKWIEKYR